MRLYSYHGRNTRCMEIGFIILTIIELVYFYWATGKQQKFLIAAFLWLIITGILAYSGFFEKTDVMPPRFLLLFIPTIIVWVLLGWSKFGSKFRSLVNLERLHYIHIVRIFVEMVFLFGLFKQGLVAKELTFLGNNMDIIPGLTAPIIALLYFRFKIIGKKVLIGWNVVCLFVLLFTISQAILSAPFPFQQLSLEQPTVAILYFPYNWLAAFVAPLVILAHLICIKLLLKKNEV